MPPSGTRCHTPCHDVSPNIAYYSPIIDDFWLRIGDTSNFYFSVFPMIRWFRCRRHDLPLHSTHGASNTLFIHLHPPLGIFTVPQPFLWCFFISSCFFFFLCSFYSDIISHSNVYVFCSRLNARAYAKTPEKCDYLIF